MFSTVRASKPTFVTLYQKRSAHTTPFRRHTVPFSLAGVDQSHPQGRILLFFCRLGNAPPRRSSAEYTRENLSVNYYQEKTFQTFHLLDSLSLCKEVQ